MWARSAGLPRSLSARFQGDFAYPTVKDRMPAILTKVVDTIFLKKVHSKLEISSDGLEDLQQICAVLSQLKNEMQTNNNLTDLPEDGTGDEVQWNECIKADRQLQQSEGSESSWFVSSFLLVECYFYRRIYSAIRLSSRFKSLDPYSAQKESLFMQSLPAVTTLASYVLDIEMDIKDFGDQFSALFHVALWGNKCDLCFSAAVNNYETNVDPIGQAKLLQSNVVGTDDTARVWHLLASTKPHRCVDIVLDNAGFEFFADLCVAEFLMSSGTASRIRFHGKQIPWFVSDVTASDWQWTVEHLSNSSTAALCQLGKRWQQYLLDGIWQFSTHPFWTLPYDFTSMKSVARDLYDDLSTADLVLFKGDLNYRKLVGDRVWPPTTPFDIALCGFCPTSLCCLRTLKCDVVVGLPEGQAELLQAQETNWMVTGSYAVIQFANAA